MLRSTFFIVVLKVKNKKVKVYRKVNEFLEQTKQLNTNINIVIDNNLGCPVTGIDILIYLHSIGFKKLYLASGAAIAGVPDYIKLINKKILNIFYNIY